jgi:phosphoribosylformylglycinamidine cyclo-ligase
MCSTLEYCSVSSQELRSSQRADTITAHPCRILKLSDDSLTYQNAGVSIDRGNALVERIKPLTAATRRVGVVGALGGFAGIFDLAKTGYRDPLLLACTDGVGTKLLLAMSLDRYDTVGIDLVAMCVNDLIVSGAEPLMFLDYYASGVLDVDKAERVIKGIADGCAQAGAALIGGETAEMPGMYPLGEFDLAGFCVGAVEREKLIDGSKIAASDILIGLASSGPHSNGYSLIRKIIERNRIDTNTELNGRSLAETLLSPTRIYVRPILDLLGKQAPIHGMAHITGGGLLENVPRVLPDTLSAHIKRSSWQRQEVFDWLQEKGNVSDQEMWRTFNCGIGMVLVVPGQYADSTVEHFNSQGVRAYRIGEIRPRRSGQPPIAIE